jgi:hypothetical protein
LYQWNPENTGFLKFLGKPNHKNTIQKPYHGHNIQSVRRNFGKLTHNRAQDKRRKNEVQPVSKRQIGVLARTSSDKLELPGSNSVIVQNQEI